MPFAIYTLNWSIPIKKIHTNRTDIDPKLSQCWPNVDPTLTWLDLTSTEPDLTRLITDSNWPEIDSVLTWHSTWSDRDLTFIRIDSTSIGDIEIETRQIDSFVLIYLFFWIDPKFMLISTESIFLFLLILRIRIKF